MFYTAKRAEPFAMFDNALGQTFANSGKLLELGGGRRVDIDPLRVSLIGQCRDVWRIARLLIVRLFLSCLMRLLVTIAG